MRIKTKLSLLLERSLLMFFSAAAKKRRPHKKTGKVLIARTDGLGDYILWLSVEENLRNLYPDSRIEMLFDERKPTPELAAYDPYIDGFFSLPIVSWRRFLSVLAMSRKEYDVIIQPVYSRLALTDTLLFAAKAQKRITIDTNGQYLTPQELKWTNHGYDVIVKASARLEHELTRCAELLRGLGVKEFHACLPDINCLAITVKKLAGDYIMVFPSASWSGKVWEKEKYAQVIQWLLRHFSGSIYLCGDSGDREICQWIGKAVNVPSRLQSLAGKIDMAQLTAHIKGARLVFGNDTGAIHVAVACKIPAVAIVANREIGRFLPYQTNNAAEQKYYPVCVHDADMKCSGCVLKGEVVCRYQKDVLQVLPCIQHITTAQVIKVLKEKIREAPCGISYQIS